MSGLSVVEAKSAVVWASVVVPSFVWIVDKSGGAVEAAVVVTFSVVSVVEATSDAVVVGAVDGAVDGPASLEGAGVLLESIPEALLALIVVASCPGAKVEVTSSDAVVCSVVSVKLPPSSTDCVVSVAGNSVVVPGSLGSLATVVVMSSLCVVCASVEVKNATVL